MCQQLYKIEKRLKFVNPDFYLYIYDKKTVDFVVRGKQIIAASLGFYKVIFSTRETTKSARISPVTLPEGVSNQLHRAGATLRVVQ
jgi:hypothetical protein